MSRVCWAMAAAAWSLGKKTSETWVVQSSGLSSVTVTLNRFVFHLSACAAAGAAAASVSAPARIREIRTRHPSGRSRPVRSRASLGPPRGRCESCAPAPRPNASLTMDRAKPAYRFAARDKAMSPAETLEFARDGLWLMISMAAPVMIIGLAVGLAIALFQALTQVQEMTLVFVPKIIAIFVALVVFLPLMGALMGGYMTRIFERIALM